MKTLAVDLRSRSTSPRWAWGLVGLLYMLAAGLGSAAYRESQTLKALKAQRGELLRQLTVAPETPAAVPVQKMPYDASAREMLRLATSEWPTMLTAVESAEVIGVLPAALEIVPAERWIRMELEFTEYAKLLEYIDALNAGATRPKWSLVQAQTGSRSSSSAPAAASTATVRGAW